MKKVSVLTVAFALLGLALSPLAAADSQTRSPANATEGSSQGDTAVNNWVDIANASGPPDGNIATHIMEDSAGWGNMHSISFDDYGFSIPSNAVIDGIELVVAWDVITPAVGTGSNVFGISVDAINAYDGLLGGAGEYRVIAGTTQCNTDAYNTVPYADKAALAAVCTPVALSGHEWIYDGWPHDGSGLADPYLTRGSPTDMWGANEVDGNGLTPAEINTASFGVVHMARAGGAGDTFAIDGMTMTIYFTIPPVEMTGFTKDGDDASAFDTGTGTWNVTFAESVDNVTDDDFAVDVTGTAAFTGGPTVTPGSGSALTIVVTGITGEGTIRLRLKDNTDMTDTATGTFPVAGASGPAYSNIAALLPAASNWTLLLTVLAIGLCAGIVVARKTIRS